MKRGNWTDRPCFYVSVIDGPKRALVAGPYRTHKEALAKVEPAKEAGAKADPWSTFYAWGTAKAPNGYREGMLNKALEGGA